MSVFDDNPFYVPSDEKIFQMRDDERRQKLESRDKLNSMTMWERADIEIKAMQTKIKPMDIGLGVTHTARKSVSAGAVDAGTGVPTVLGARHREKENLTDFISKKRDMFLVQMSLDTKKAEIQKLEKKASMKEDALRRSELMLEQDAIRFDRFLKDNDKNAHEAIRRQESETREKQEKIAEHKRMTADRAKIEAEIAKVAEQLAACVSYKQFLEKLVPEEWKAEQAKLRAEAMKSKNADDSELLEEPMYFREPAQLLRLFGDLEERSLFLIQNCQETEEGLEELKQKFAEAEHAMTEKNSVLQQTVDELQQKIAAEHETANALREQAFGSAGTGAQGRLLNDLTQSVRATYELTGHAAENNMSALSMLSDIERNLESLISNINRMDEEWRVNCEKTKEASRRQRVRRERIVEQEAKDEERMLRMQKRATEIKPKRVGKPLMFRSPPFEKKNKQENPLKQQKHDDEDMIKRFFTL